VSPSSSVSKNKPEEIPACYLLHSDFLLGLSFLKMEATCFSETSVGFQRTTLHYISEDGTVQIEKKKIGERDNDLI
jgi:hypothetical protein